MVSGRGGMGSRKHGKSGHSTKSPKFRFFNKMEAEKNKIKDKSRIKEPYSSIKELMNKNSS